MGNAGAKIVKEKGSDGGAFWTRFPDAYDLRYGARQAETARKVLDPLFGICRAVVFGVLCHRVLVDSGSASGGVYMNMASQERPLLSAIVLAVPVLVSILLAVVYCFKATIDWNIIRFNNKFFEACRNSLTFVPNTDYSPGFSSFFNNIYLFLASVLMCAAVLMAPDTWTAINIATHNSIFDAVLVSVLFLLVVEYPRVAAACIMEPMHALQTAEAIFNMYHMTKQEFIHAQKESDTPADAEEGEVEDGESTSAST